MLDTGLKKTSALVVVLALSAGLGVAGLNGCAKKEAPTGQEQAQGEESGLININTAPYEELEKLELPGTKPGLDHRIEEGRPYKTIEELLEKGVADQEEFDLIKDLITAGDGKTFVPVEKSEGESEEEEEAEKEETGEAGEGASQTPAEEEGQQE